MKIIYSVKKRIIFNYNMSINIRLAKKCIQNTVKLY